jgi:hypothetical protein
MLGEELLRLMMQRSFLCLPGKTVENQEHFNVDTKIGFVLVPTYVYLLKDDKGKGGGGFGVGQNGQLRPRGSLYVICIVKLLAVAVQQKLISCALAVKGRLIVTYRIPQ